MREIKLRAWDKIQNVMFNFDIYNVPPYVGQTYLVGEKFERIYEIMQYTGLKDINGTEIYEGDIIWDAHAEINGKVTFDEGAFCVEWATHIEHLFEVIIDGYAEVVGSFFENPELLERK